MKRVILAAASTLAGLVMLLSFKTHGTIKVSAAAAGGADPGAGAAPTPTTTPAATPTTASGAHAPATPAAPTGARTVTGDPADTRYGPVEVQITVSGGTITGVKALEYPWNRSRDQEINSFAIPQLDQEVLAAKSGQIDMVSGATYTSDGYITSLQSALSKAGLA